MTNFVITDDDIAPVAIVGTTVEGNWGAMHPIDKGVITEVVGDTAWVRWEYESGRVWNNHYKIKDLRSAYSGYGSPIGVYITV